MFRGFSKTAHPQTIHVGFVVIAGSSFPRLDFGSDVQLSSNLYSASVITIVESWVTNRASVQSLNGRQTVIDLRGQQQPNSMWPNQSLRLVMTSNPALKSTSQVLAFAVPFPI